MTAALHSLANSIRSLMRDPDVARLAEQYLAETDRRGLFSDWGSSPEWDYPPCPEKLQDFNRLLVATSRVLPPGGSIETGIFRGGTSGSLILCAPPNAFHVAIDPFGLPGQSYKDDEGRVYEDYSSWPHARSTLLQLTALAHEREVTFCQYMMSAQTFIDSDLLQHPAQFRIVHLDGDHSAQATSKELRYFRNKISGPTLFILDDHDDNFPGVQDGLNESGYGLVSIFHKLYKLSYMSSSSGFSAWLHVAA